MEVKASDVKALRERTGAGMLDCKNALVNANGDFAKAEKTLKELGLAAAAKRSGRATNEGRVFSLVRDQNAALLELSCETDFVAMNADFKDMGEKLLNVIVDEGLEEPNDTTEAIVKEGISKIKENITLKRFKTMRREENELIVDYIHGEGKIGVLVKLRAESAELLSKDPVKDFAFNCALHIAAFNPAFLNRDAVDPAYLAEQEEIFQKQTANLDKPENVKAGIVKGKLNKHLSEVVMLEQGYVKEEKKKVSEVIKNVSNEAGGKVELTDFLYYRVGEEA